jgi:hypothetical protein
MKKILLLLFVLLFVSGCSLVSKPLTNEEINSKLKNGDLTCNTGDDCEKLGYKCIGNDKQPVCVNAGDINVTNGEPYEYSACFCLNPKFEY